MINICTIYNETAVFYLDNVFASDSSEVKLDINHLALFKEYVLKITKKYGRYSPVNDAASP